VDTPEGAKMREEMFMARRKRRQFTPEFKAEAVRLARVGDRSIGQVAADLDLTETALREWVRRAEADAGKGVPDTLTTAEREELTRLRRENKRLQMERDILKAAATFFAKVFPSWLADGIASRLCDGHRAGGSMSAKRNGHRAGGRRARRDGHQRSGVLPRLRTMAAGAVALRS